MFKKIVIRNCSATNTKLFNVNVKLSVHRFHRYRTTMVRTIDRWLTWDILLNWNRCNFYICESTNITVSEMMFCEHHKAAFVFVREASVWESGEILLKGIAHTIWSVSVSEVANRSEFLFDELAVDSLFSFDCTAGSREYWSPHWGCTISAWSITTVTYGGNIWQ